MEWIIFQRNYHYELASGDMKIILRSHKCQADTNKPHINNDDSPPFSFPSRRQPTTYLRDLSVHIVVLWHDAIIIVEDQRELRFR